MSDNDLRTIAAYWHEWPDETRALFGYLYRLALQDWNGTGGAAWCWFGRHMLNTR